MKAKSINQSLA